LAEPSSGPGVSVAILDLAIKNQSRVEHHANRSPNTLGVYRGQRQRAAALFDHLNRPNGCIQSHSPASFSYEEAPSAERASRRDALIKELRPVCNSSNLPE